MVCLEAELFLFCSFFPPGERPRCIFEKAKNTVIFHVFTLKDGVSSRSLEDTKARIPTQQTETGSAEGVNETIKIHYRMPSGEDLHLLAAMCRSPTSRVFESAFFFKLNSGSPLVALFIKREALFFPKRGHDK